MAPIVTRTDMQGEGEFHNNNNSQAELTRPKSGSSENNGGTQHKNNGTQTVRKGASHTKGEKTMKKLAKIINWPHEVQKCLKGRQVVLVEKKRRI
jgi:hypothetical protein